MAVSKAVRGKRLRESVEVGPNGRPFIVNPDLADKEWDENTDHSRAPGYVKEHADKARARRRKGKGRRSTKQGPALSDSSAEEKRWRAKIAELKYREADGELVRSSVVERLWAAEIVATKTKILGIPARVRLRAPALTDGDIALIEEEVRAALEDVAADQAVPDTAGHGA